VRSAWNGVLTSSGNHYTVRNKPYNATIDPGGSSTFGFGARGSAAPLNCRLNGAPC
jgi:Cellulose binding domain